MTLAWNNPEYPPRQNPALTHGHERTPFKNHAPLIICWLAWLALCAGSVQAFAAEGRVALVIGNAAYSQKPLKNPVNDAEDLAATLKDLGFEVLLRKNRSEEQMKQDLVYFQDRLERSKGVGVICLRGRSEDPRGQAQGGRQARVPARSRAPDCRGVLRLGEGQSGGSGASAQQPADQGARLRAQATRGAGSVSGRPGGADRHQPPRTGATADSDGKNWMFSWIELGARHVGVVQSLIATCRLHHIDPYDYLVDVLQLVGQHPAADVVQLTPRLWTQHFGANPLRSDISRHVA